MDETRASSLTPQQARAIPVLVQAPTVEQGVRRLGKSKTTICKWFRNPAFREELNRQKDELMDVALEALKSSVEKAVQVLVSLLESENETVRRNVANDVLCHALKAKELKELEHRLAAIEQRVRENSIL
jgi:HEAT repeat protein